MKRLYEAIQEAQEEQSRVWPEVAAIEHSEKVVNLLLESIRQKMKK